MTKLFLSAKATLEGVTGLKPKDSPQDKYEYTFTIECTRCRTVHDKPVTINQYEHHEHAGSRGESSFVFRCKECKSEHNANIEVTKKTVDESEVWTPLLELDARGLDFKSFIPQGQFECVGAESGTKFAEVELEENEWYDYDEKTGAEVSITEVEWRIERT
ncbi:hypothetical protein DICA4_B07250 [Diutina catenulata]